MTGYLFHFCSCRQGLLALSSVRLFLLTALLYFCSCCHRFFVSFFPCFSLFFLFVSFFPSLYHLKVVLVVKIFFPPPDSFIPRTFFFTVDWYNNMPTVTVFLVCRHL